MKTSINPSDKTQFINEKYLIITSLKQELSETIQRYNKRLLNIDANKQAINGLLTRYTLTLY